MNNSNVADLSVFESIQDNANTQMSISSGMAVFNAQFKITDPKKYNSACDFTVRMVADRKVKFKAEEKKLKDWKSELKRHQDALSQGRANADTAGKILGLEDKIKRQKCLLESGIREFSKHGIKVTSREL